MFEIGASPMCDGASAVFRTMRHVVQEATPKVVEEGKLAFLYTLQMVMLSLLIVLLCPFRNIHESMWNLHTKTVALLNNRIVGYSTKFMVVSHQPEVKRSHEARLEEAERSISKLDKSSVSKGDIENFGKMTSRVKKMLTSTDAIRLNVAIDTLNTLEKKLGATEKRKPVPTKADAEEKEGQETIVESAKTEVVEAESGSTEETEETATSNLVEFKNRVGEDLSRVSNGIKSIKSIFVKSSPTTEQTLLQEIENYDKTKRQQSTETS